jgi:hypothetical protein
MQTQVRFHGDVPPAFRDPQPVTVEAAKLNVTKLVAQKDQLNATLEPLLDKIQAGSATPEEMTVVAELGEDARIVANRLHQAQVQLTVAEEKQARQQAATKRERFDRLVIDTRQKRSEFARLYREACIVLGSLCANVDEATALANASIGIAGMLPLDRNSIAEMSENPDPLPALLDSGLSPTTGFGWDFRIAVVPLQKKG